MAGVDFDFRKRWPPPLRCMAWFVGRIATGTQSQSARMDLVLTIQGLFFRRTSSTVLFRCKFLVRIELKITARWTAKCNSRQAFICRWHFRSTKNALFWLAFEPQAHRTTRETVVKKVSLRHLGLTLGAGLRLISHLKLSFGWEELSDERYPSPSPRK